MEVSTYSQGQVVYGGRLPHKWDFDYFEILNLGESSEHILSLNYLKGLNFVRILKYTVMVIAE